MKPNLLTTHINTYQRRTWGRVYITFEKEGQEFYAFKNWQNFEEHNYIGLGNIEDEPSYTWALAENRFEFSIEEVLNGNADNLVLTPEKHKTIYGTPSVLLKRLLIDVKSNNLEPIANRRGWYERFFRPEINLSTIKITANYRQIVFEDYDFEIKLEPLQKLVYLFFLKNPEGVTRSQFSDGEVELLEIYQKIARSTDLEVLKKRISELINLDSNSLDEKISKIKKNLIDNLGKKVAANYYISGLKSGIYKINIADELIQFV